MPQKWNPQTVVVNSSSSSIAVIKNFSSTAFLYVWKIQLTVTGATLLTFQQTTISDGTFALSGAFDLTAAGGSITQPEGNSPWYTVDPGATFVLANSGSVSVQGQVMYSN